jgi:hypothetical protein
MGDSSTRNRLKLPSGVGSVIWVSDEPDAVLNSIGARLSARLNARRFNLTVRYEFGMTLRRLLFEIELSSMSLQYSSVVSSDCAALARERMLPAIVIEASKTAASTKASVE